VLITRTDHCTIPLLSPVRLLVLLDSGDTIHRPRTSGSAVRKRTPTDPARSPRARRNGPFPDSDRDTYPRPHSIHYCTRPMNLLHDEGDRTSSRLVRVRFLHFAISALSSAAGQGLAPCCGPSSPMYRPSGRTFYYRGAKPVSPAALTSSSRFSMSSRPDNMISTA
jgi:hypothetical protein